MTWSWCSALLVASPCWCKGVSWSKERRRRSLRMHVCARSISASASMDDCLALLDISAGYHETVVLEQISLSLREGATLAVLGRNGVGKSTLLATVLGHTTLHAGQVVFRGQPIDRMRPFRRVRLGIGSVPQEREIFPSLTVEENLKVAARSGNRWSHE